MKFTTFFLSYCLICSLASADDDLTRQLLETMGWSDQLQSYELELTVDKSGQYDEKFFEDIKIVREVYDASEEFFIGTTTGRLDIDGKTSRQRDQTLEILAYGDRFDARREVLNSNFAVSEFRCGPTGVPCRVAARGFDFSDMPLAFVIPVMDGPKDELRSFLTFAGQEKKLNSEALKIGSPGKQSNAKVIKISRLVPFADRAETRGVAYRLVISDEGTEKGRVLELCKGELRAGVESYQTNDDVQYFDCSIAIEWEVVDTEKPVVVPRSIVKKFGYDSINNRRVSDNYIVERSTFDWRKVNEPLGASFTRKYVQDVMLKNLTRVNAKLNR